MNSQTFYPDKKIIAIVGPTASGKSDLALMLAKKFKGEIISVDSRGIYRGLEIGSSAVAGKWVKKNGKNIFIYKTIPHHLVATVNPEKTFSAFDFAKSATKLIKKIEIPILVGGSGFWLDALTQPDLLADAPPNRGLRKKLSSFSKTKLLSILKKYNPGKAGQMQKLPARKIIRAIEIADFEKRKRVKQLKSQPQFKILYLGLTATNPVIKTKIKKRFVKDLKRGLLTETKKLQQAVSSPRLKELGLYYPIIADYQKGKITKDEMIERSVNTVYHYAKRQKTWFKRNPKIIWVKNKKQALQLVQKFLAAK